MSKMEKLRQSRENMRKIEGGINARRTASLLDVYEAALDAVEDNEMFEELAAEEIFANRRKKLNQADSLRLSLVYAMDANSKSLYDRCCTYAKALQPSFDARVPPDEVEAIIDEAGGIEALYRMNVENEKSLNLGLQLEATLDQLRQTLSVEVGDEVVIVARRLEDGPREWKRFEIIDIEADE